MRFLERVEKRALRWQGKGFGGRKALQAEVRAALAHLPPSGATVFDVGANKGAWAQELLARAGARVAKIYCFEPSRAHHDTIRAIGDPRIVVVGKAVADVPGRMTLYADKPGSALASLAKRELAHHGIEMKPSETVEVTTIDQVIEEFGIATIDYAKFDVEGFEYKAFLGAKRAFETRKIRALAFEFGGTDIDTRTYFRDFWFFLTGYGYKIGIINPIGRPRPIERYRERLEIFSTTNYIAWLEK